MVKNSAREGGEPLIAENILKLAKEYTLMDNQKITGNEIGKTAFLKFNLTTGTY